jgi:hypothetical protein
MNVYNEEKLIKSGFVPPNLLEFKNSNQQEKFSLIIGENWFFLLFCLLFIFKDK